MELYCKNCQFWDSKDRVTGYCEKSEDNKNESFWIEDVAGYRPILMTEWDFYCNLHQLHKNVHLPGSDF